MPLHTIEFQSESLARLATLCVFVPSAGSERSEESRYPVVYCHHGLGGTYRSFPDKTDIEALADQAGLILALPDAGRSWFANDPRDGLRWEDHLADEVVRLVDESFPTIPERTARGQCGFSMGGYGAMVLTMLHPDRFSVACSLAGSMMFGHELRPDRPERSEMMMAVAPPGGRYDLFALAERIASLSEGDRPAFRMNVGHDDHLLEANRQLRDRFDEVGLPYEYAEVEGGHHWQYVSAQLPEAVDYLVEHLDFGS